MPEFRSIASMSLVHMFHGFERSPRATRVDAETAIHKRSGAASIRVISPGPDKGATARVVVNYVRYEVHHRR
jgi:hypothetical protein